MKQTSQDRVGDAASLLLSPAQRRRRSLYFPEAAAEPANNQYVSNRYPITIGPAMPFLLLPRVHVAPAQIPQFPGHRRALIR